MHNFDQFAEDYVAINDRYASFFREKTDYFAAYKAAYVARLCSVAFDGRILDFGCGIGLVTNRLGGLLPLARIDGVDSSAASIARARSGATDPSRICYFESETELTGSYDIVVLANVLHHVPASERPAVLGRVFGLLNRGGRVVVFEHNTWNPLVMRIVRNHPFDRDAVFLPPSETARLARAAGLMPRIDFIVFFPAFLKMLRPLERYLRMLPIGGQYACVGTKPN